MTEIYVRTDFDDGVLYIRWHNPAAKHAFTRLMYEQICLALEQAEARDDIKICVFLGGSGDFCSGNDLAEFSTGRLQGALFFRPLLEFIRRLAEFKKPLLAAVDGWAVGIGATLLLHCDAVIASPNAQFSLPFGRLGLCCECGASLLLPLRIGRGRAADWLLSGAPMGAVEAQRIGFINGVEEDPIAAIVNYARQLSKRPLGALLAHRALLNAPWQTMLKQAMAAEEVHFFGLLKSAEFCATLTSLAQKTTSQQ